MVQSYRQCRTGIVILMLIALSFGVGGKANLCFTPGGAVHIEANHISCALTGALAPHPDSLPFSGSQVAEKEDHCLDLSLGGDASDRHHCQKIAPPAPAIVSSPPTFQLPQNEPEIFIATSPRPPRHLQPLHSVLLLI